jgi:hypothetical protein
MKLVSRASVLTIATSHAIRHGLYDRHKAITAVRLFTANLTANSEQENSPFFGLFWCKLQRCKRCLLP